jgi:hypothetical protein
MSGATYIDQNARQDFIDQLGVMLFIDEDGNFLGTNGVPDTDAASPDVAPMLFVDSDTLYVPVVGGGTRSTLRFSVFYH